VELTLIYVVREIWFCGN